MEPPPERPIKTEPLTPVSPSESGFVLGMAIAPAVVGLVAFVVSFFPFLSGTGNVPRGLIFVILVQVVAIGLLRLHEDHPLVESWVSTLICSAVLVPLTALQVALLREPYVSLERSTASPAIVATVVVSMVLLVGAVWSVWTSWRHPDEAGLLFMPQAMIVPGLIGMRSTINQRPALEMLAEVMLLAATAMAVAWLLPPIHRMLAPAVALAILFVLLWVTGHGPWFHATSGGIVRVLYSVMLAVAVVLVVVVPLVALWIRNGARRPPVRAGKAAPARRPAPAGRATAGRDRARIDR